MSAKPKLTQLAEDFLAALAHERAASPHTLRAYDRELHNFADYSIEKLGRSITPRAIDHKHIRAYLGELYARGLSKASVARALAALRSWFKWMARHGHVEQNAASLVATPKLPKHLPRVPSIEQMNRTVDALAMMKWQLKGHGFSRALAANESEAASAAEGVNPNSRNTGATKRDYSIPRNRLARTRPRHLRTPLWMRHPQCRANRPQPRRPSLGQRGNPRPR